MTETRGELAHRLVFVMRFVSGESRTSGNRKAITGCCPVRASAVQACLQTHSLCECTIRRKPDSEKKRSGIELSPDEAGVRGELAHRLVFVMRFVSGTGNCCCIC
ncbi:MAG: hypothetical protein K2J60_03105 [Acetatifactor sp.]|nr:hypothetical protein [Acetatifactor sp.]